MKKYMALHSLQQFREWNFGRVMLAF